MTFQRVYEYGILKAPQLAPRNTHCIHEWLSYGYDPEKDIIPAIDIATKAGSRTIQSWSYFTGLIRTMNDRRIKQENKPIQCTPAESEAKRAEKIRWFRDRGLTSTSIGPNDYAWLEQYEKEHGPIAI